MAQPDAHTRLISWLKIVLPLVALGILSTLFLVARTVNPDDAIPYAEVDVAERIREPRMTDASYAGMTRDGASLTLTAAEARPAGTDGAATAKRLVGQLETADGLTTDLVAAQAKIDSENRTITLFGGVELKQTNGWNVASETLVAHMDRTEVTSPGQVSAFGPAGTLTASSMQLTENPKTPSRYLMVFNGSVKLVYDPSN